MMIMTREKQASEHECNGDAIKVIIASTAIIISLNAPLPLLKGLLREHGKRIM